MKSETDMTSSDECCDAVNETLEEHGLHRSPHRCPHHCQHQHHYHHNHHFDKQNSCTPIFSYSYLFFMCIIAMMTISSAYSLAPDLLHTHRFRQLGYLSSASSDEWDDRHRQHRNVGPLPYHLLYDKHRIDPYFDSTTLPTNVSVSEGSAATYLPCRVRQLGDRTVSWIRRKDLHVLTVGKFTYTSDQRFQAVHLDNSDDWTLQIRYPLRKDAGIYECQVSTLPKMSIFINLNVIVAKAKIIGGPLLYINSGSTLNLSCVVNETPGPPDYIFWYHNGDVINYDSPRGIKVQTEKLAQTTSKLIISKVVPNDSGNYSCSPSNAEAAHIAVHINSNSNPAASIQHGKRSARDFISNNAHARQTYNNSIYLIINISLPIILFTINIYHECNSR